MPNVSGSYAIPRMDLGVAMREYQINAEGLIGTQVLPIFETPKKSAAFSKITRASLLRSRNVRRAARTAYSRDTFDAKDQTYNCKERGHEQPCDDSERALYANDFNCDLECSMLAMDVVRQEQEKDIAAMLRDTSVWTGAALFTDNKATPWSTAGTDILAQIIAGAEKVRTNCGLRPNALIIGAATLANMRLNTGIKDAIKYVAVPTIDQITQLLAALCGVKKVLVGDLIKNSAKEGQDFTGADVWGKKYAMLARIAETKNLNEPCLGRTMLWVSDSPNAVMVEQYREEQTRSDVFRARHNADEVVFDPSYAHLLQIETAD